MTTPSMAPQSLVSAMTRSPTRTLEITLVSPAPQRPRRGVRSTPIVLNFCSKSTGGQLAAYLPQAKRLTAGAMHVVFTDSRTAAPSAPRTPPLPHERGQREVSARSAAAAAHAFAP